MVSFHNPVYGPGEATRGIWAPWEATEQWQKTQGFCAIWRMMLPSYMSFIHCLLFNQKIRINLKGPFFLICFSRYPDIQPYPNPFLGDTLERHPSNWRIPIGFLYLYILDIPGRCYPYYILTGSFQRDKISIMIIPKRQPWMVSFHKFYGNCTWNSTWNLRSSLQACA